MRFMFISQIFHIKISFDANWNQSSKQLSFFLSVVSNVTERTKLNLMMLSKVFLGDNFIIISINTKIHFRWLFFLFAFGMVFRSDSSEFKFTREATRRRKNDKLNELPNEVFSFHSALTEWAFFWPTSGPPPTKPIDGSDVCNESKTSQKPSYQEKLFNLNENFSPTCRKKNYCTAHVEQLHKKKYQRIIYKRQLCVSSVKEKNEEKKLNRKMW